MLLSLVILTFFILEIYLLGYICTKNLELFVIGEIWHLLLFEFVEIIDDASFSIFRPEKPF